jgi:hypothetical protein
MRKKKPVYMWNKCASFQTLTLTEALVRIGAVCVDSKHLSGICDTLWIKKSKQNKRDRCVKIGMKGEF